MLLWDRSEEGGSGRCCGALDLSDARRVAGQCGIPHYTLRMEEEFRRHVVDPFVDEYLAGRTPVPCTRCNTFVKFDLFLERARVLGAGRMATGHYARIVAGDGELELHTARHDAKDQSYYLFELTQEQLAASRFPLGEHTKDDVRGLAAQAGLAVAGKGESMELCFVAGGVRDFVERESSRRPDRFAVLADRPSRMVDRSGRQMGRGEPYYRYTVGQRRGLGVTAAEPLYVLAIDPGKNRVTVGPRPELAAGGLLGTGLHWIGRPPGGEIEASVRIRSRHCGAPALVRSLPDGRAVVEFAEPQQGVAPGQAAVFYRGTRVLGGCWIERSLPA
jgi:tRNA-specific 2-thiouridylase